MATPDHQGARMLLRTFINPPYAMTSDATMRLQVFGRVKSAAANLLKQYDFDVEPWASPSGDMFRVSRRTLQRKSVDVLTNAGGITIVSGPTGTLNPHQHLVPLTLDHDLIVYGEPLLDANGDACRDLSIPGCPPVFLDPVESVIRAILVALK